MKKKLRKIVKKNEKLIDIVALPFVWWSAIILKLYRKSTYIKGFSFPHSKKALLDVGVFPIIDHYYEPMFQPKHLYKPLSEERKLHGIDWNVDEQLSILKDFHFQQELNNIPEDYIDDTQFYFKNTVFATGDSEYWYNIIRLKKPKRIIEIGSGQSTKMAQLAIQANHKADTGYQCKHICIEPYEYAWLEKIGVEVKREKVEDVNLDFFRQLEANDILFIDSSHIIRPQGDVLFEYLELLPTLKSGVIVHIHDIFSPRNYLDEWVIDKVRFWNEQYLLEAFLSFNSSWKIIGSLNYLQHNYFDFLSEKCPKLTKEREPGSFYIVKT
ncbi:MAG: class I SAM-dependent methyltransferase [Candidatus Symbiothrix sp.]|jgi:hypothetical protein|nr:class I SAM-dependent methyltransferase [Candidatus Symbiothrix sp.]